MCEYNYKWRDNSRILIVESEAAAAVLARRGEEKRGEECDRANKLGVIFTSLCDEHLVEGWRGEVCIRGCA